MSSRNVVDLRGKRTGTPPPGQSPLFAAPPKRERRSPLRARRRKILVIKIFFVVLLLAGVVWGISLVSYLPRFSIQEVDVVGTEHVPPQVIREYVWAILLNGSHHYLSRDNIFVYPKAVIARDVASDFPRIASATISRPSLMSTTLVVNVTERSPFALWCLPAQAGPLVQVGSIEQAGISAQAGTSTQATGGDGQCYEMDQTGYIFAEAGATSSVPSHYVFSGGLTSTAASTTSAHAPDDPIGLSFVPAHLPGLIVLLRELGQAGFDPLGVNIDVPSIDTGSQDFEVPMAAGFVVKASFGEDADTLAKNLQLVLSSDTLQGKTADLEYVDLRFGDKVYYKLKGQDQAAAQ